MSGDYFNADGEATLEWLCRDDPDWAASRLRVIAAERNAMRADVERLRGEVNTQEERITAAVAAERERLAGLVRCEDVDESVFNSSRQMPCDCDNCLAFATPETEEPICGRCGRLARLHHALPCIIRAAVAAERKRIAAVAAAHDLADWWAELDHLTQLPPTKESPMTRKSSPYAACTTWDFEAAGCNFTIVAFDEARVCVEESEKNGQEDTHFYGELYKTDGKWILEEDARKHLRQYECEATATALEAFINEHDLPETPGRSD